MVEPRSRQFALVAQLAGEVDELMKRAERLPALIDTATQQLKDNATAADTAFSQYRVEAQTINLQIMKSIAEFAVNHTNEVAIKTTEEQKTILQKCAHDAFEKELAPHLKKLAEVVETDKQKPQRPIWISWVEHAATAVLSVSLLMAVLHFMRN